MTTTVGVEKLASNASNVINAYVLLQTDEILPNPVTKLNEPAVFSQVYQTLGITPTTWFISQLTLSQVRTVQVGISVYQFNVRFVQVGTKDAQASQFVGPQGPQGLQGPQGGVGPAGSVGPQGPAGPAGSLLAKLGRYYFVDDLLGDDGTAQSNSLNYRYKTIAAAVSAAKAGGEIGATVLVAPGTYAETVDLTGVPSSFTLMGTDPAATVIDNGGSGGAAKIIYAEGTGIDRLTVRDLTVRTRNGDWGVYVDGADAVLAEMLTIDNVRSTALEAGAQGVYLENVTNAVIKNSEVQAYGEAQAAVRLANCGTVDVENVRALGQGAEIDLRYGVSPVGTPPTRGVYRLREVWIAENLRMAGYPNVYADASVTLDPQATSGKVYTPIVGLTLSGAPDNLGAKIGFHGSARRFSIYLAAYDAAQLQSVDLSGARFYGAISSDLGVASGITAWANAHNLQGIQAPESTAITIGAGLLVEAAGTNVNPNVWSTGANAKLNANAIGGDAVLNGNTNVVVNLPWSQNDASYLVYLEWSGSPQYYAITGKSATQFQVDIGAAAVGDQSFLYALRRTRNL